MLATLIVNGFLPSTISETNKKCITATVTRIKLWTIYFTYLDRQEPQAQLTTYDINLLPANGSTDFFLQFN